MPDFSKGLNRFQLQEVYAIAVELPPFSDDLSVFDLVRHTLVSALIDDKGLPEIPATIRQANIIQGRFRLLFNIDTAGIVTDEHFARLEFYAKEVYREISKTEAEIREILAGGCDHA